MITQERMALVLGHPSDIPLTTSGCNWEMLPVSHTKADSEQVTAVAGELGAVLLDEGVRQRAMSTMAVACVSGQNVLFDQGMASYRFDFCAESAPVVGDYSWLDAMLQQTRAFHAARCAMRGTLGKPLVVNAIEPGGVLPTHRDFFQGNVDVVCLRGGGVSRVLDPEDLTYHEFAMQPGDEFRLVNPAERRLRPYHSVHNPSSEPRLSLVFQHEKPVI